MKNMKTIVLTTVLSAGIAVAATAQAFFTETFGSASSGTSWPVAAYATAGNNGASAFDNAGSIAYKGSSSNAPTIKSAEGMSPVRPSSGYNGASGSNAVLLNRAPENASKPYSFTISNINTAGKKNIYLYFGIYKNASGVTGNIEATVTAATAGITKIYTFSPTLNGRRNWELIAIPLKDEAGQFVQAETVDVKIANKHFYNGSPETNVNVYIDDVKLSEGAL